MDVRVAAALVCAVLATAACSKSAPESVSTAVRPSPRVTPSERQSVIADWYVDGVFNRPHRCVAVRAALVSLPTSFVYSTLVEDTRSLERRTCG
jgi:hypothetical protein